MRRVRYVVHILIYVAPPVGQQRNHSNPPRAFHTQQTTMRGGAGGKIPESECPGRLLRNSPLLGIPVRALGYICWVDPRPAVHGQSACRLPRAAMPSSSTVPAATTKVW